MRPDLGRACLGNYNPTQNLLEIVAMNSGNASQGWDMTGSGTYEGIAFVNGDYNAANGAGINGPVIADTGTLGAANR